MSKMKDVVILRSDDWGAIYIDGKAVDQRDGYTISSFLEIMAANGIHIGAVVRTGYLTEEADEKAQEAGCYPDELKDVDWK